MIDCENVRTLGQRGQCVSLRERDGRRGEELGKGTDMRTFTKLLCSALTFAAVAAVAASVQAAGVDKKLHDALPEEYQKNGINVAVFNDWPPDEYVENGE